MNKDHYSADGWGSASNRTTLEQREEKIINWMAEARPNEECVVLDLGCGDGCFLFALKDRFPSFKLFGGEASPVQLKKAQERLLGANLRQVNLNEVLPYSEKFFDFIFLGEVIEHLPDPESALREVRRILKPNGRIYLTTPNLMAWYNRVLFLFGCSPLFVEYSTIDASAGYGPLKRIKKSSAPVGHIKIFHPAALEDVLLLSGFHLLKKAAARFESLPGAIRWADDLVSGLWTRGGSVLLVEARK